MKKLCLLSVLVLFVASSSAQNTPKFKLYQSLGQIASSSALLRNSNEMVNVLDSIVYGGSEHPSHKTFFHYDKAGKLLTEYTEIYAWDYNQKYIREWEQKEYNDKGEIAVWNHSWLDEMDNNKETRIKYYPTYNDKGLMTEISEVFIWDEVANDWVKYLNEKIIYIYDEQGNLIESYDYIRENETTEWQLNSWDLYQIEYLDNRIEAIYRKMWFYDYFSGELITEESALAYEYNADGTVKWEKNLARNTFEWYYYGEYYYSLKNLAGIKNSSISTDNSIAWINKNILYISEKESSDFVEIYSITGQLILRTKENVIPLNNQFSGGLIVKIKDKVYKLSN